MRIGTRAKYTPWSRSGQSSVVLVVKRRDAWLIAMKVTQDRGFPVVTRQSHPGERPPEPRRMGFIGQEWAFRRFDPVVNSILVGVAKAAEMETIRIGPSWMPYTNSPHICECGRCRHVNLRTHDEFPAVLVAKRIGFGDTFKRRVVSAMPGRHQPQIRHACRIWNVLTCLEMC